MKNIIKIASVLFGSSMLFLGCNDLDLKPLDAITEEVYYKTADDFKGAVLASYSSMQNLNGTSTENLNEDAEWWKITLTTTDDVTVDPNRIGQPETSINMENLNFISSDIALQSVFTHVYQGIFRANLVLEKLKEENELTPAEKVSFEAEAKFMRAWFHFQSYKLWGGQGPLVLETRREIGNISVENSTATETVAAILEDLQFAADNLETTPWDDANLGRANSWTARAYLAKVHMYNRDLVAARPILEDVYTNGPYELEASLEDALSFDFENGKESIFEIQYASNADNNGWVLDDNHSEAFKATQGIMRGWYQDASTARGAIGADNRGAYVPTTSLIDSYEANDPRLSATLYSVDGEDYYTSDVASDTTIKYRKAWSPTGATIKKYRGLNVPKMGTNRSADINNERLFRFADLVLLYAESLIGVDNVEATRLVNEVRIRPASVGNTLTPIAAGLSDADLLTALKLERRRELAFEGHRLFDLVRWDDAVTVFAAEDKTFEMTGGTAIFPLPQTEIDRSGGVLSQVK